MCSVASLLIAGKNADFVLAPRNFLQFIFPKRTRIWTKFGCWIDVGWRNNNLA